MQQLYIEHTNIHIITKHININKYKHINIGNAATSLGNAGKIPRPQYPELIMTTPFH